MGYGGVEFEPGGGPEIKRGSMQAGDGSGSSKMASWLVKRGVVKTGKQATVFLVSIAIIFFIISLFFWIGAF
ncbi:hypothetical protein HYW53_02000 [Candidatus Giovannonibacteria bacterium]|nr:hypothetical protein [Candidatus Giovannonibacteria bacterium]